MENILKSALNDTIWLALVLVATLFALLFYIVLKWEKRVNLDQETSLNMSDVALVSLEAICQQG